MTTEWTTWTVQKLVDAKNRADSEVMLSIPQFQRTLEWDDTKKDNLVRSLQLDYPIGALLLYLDSRQSAANAKTTYLVVDGLQRISALDRYLKAPLGGFQLSAMPDDKLSAYRLSVANSAPGTKDGEEADDLLRAWLSQQQPNSDDFDATSLLAFLAREADCDRDDPELESACRAVVGEVRREWNLAAKKIPVLLYDGPRASLADVFQALNTGGKPLSVYDILNALWEQDICHTPRREIRDAVKARYASLEEEGYSVEDRGDRGYNLYEYLLGLGKFVVEGKAVPDVAFMLSKRKKQDQADAIVFSVATVVHGLRSAQMAELDEHFPRSADGIDYHGFEKALVEGVAFVRDVLSPYVNFTFRGTRGGVAHTELQLASMIARSIAGKYDIQSWRVRDTWTSDKARLAKNLPRYYVYDILGSKWSGSGDSRLYNMVWTADGSGLSDHYLQPLEDDAIAVALNEYLLTSMRERTSRRKAPTVIDRLVLKLAYRDKLKMAHYQNPADIEHLMPVKLLQTAIPRSTHHDGWAVNCVGNLAVLDRKTNREKKGLTVAEFVAAKPNEQRRLENYLFLPMSRFRVARDGSRPRLTFGQYESFCQANFAEMRARVLRTLGS